MRTQRTWSDSTCAEKSGMYSPVAARGARTRTTRFRVTPPARRRWTRPSRRRDARTHPRFCVTHRRWTRPSRRRDARTHPRFCVTHRRWTRPSRRCDARTHPRFCVTTPARSQDSDIYIDGRACRVAAVGERQPSTPIPRDRRRESKPVQTCENREDVSTRPRPSRAPRRRARSTAPPRRGTRPSRRARRACP